MKINRKQALFLCQLIGWTDAPSWGHNMMTERLNLCGQVFSRKDILAKCPGSELSFVHDIDYCLRKGDKIEVIPFKVKDEFTIASVTLTEALDIVAQEVIRRTCESLKVTEITPSNRKTQALALTLNGQTDMMVDELHKAILALLDKRK